VAGYGFEYQCSSCRWGATCTCWSPAFAWHTTAAFLPVAGLKAHLA
jgi:hypothetical protein